MRRLKKRTCKFCFRYFLTSRRPSDHFCCSAACYQRWLYKHYRRVHGLNYRTERWQILGRKTKDNPRGHVPDGHNSNGRNGHG